MKKFKSLCLIALILISNQLIFAQDKKKEKEKPEFTVDAQLRIRANIINGYTCWYKIQWDYKSFCQI
jgi:hypothetical protein